MNVESDSEERKSTIVEKIRGCSTRDTKENPQLFWSLFSDYYLLKLEEALAEKESMETVNQH